jgi:predicted O-methyltransferase YrrM
MSSRRTVKRREFLAAAGRLLSLAASPQRTRAADAASGSAIGGPAKLHRVLEEMEAQESRYWSVPRRDGELLHFLVKATQARNILEIGTSHGYSAIWMALALEETGGRLTTIEIDRTRHDLARKRLGEANLSQRATLIRGDAHAEVPKLGGPFDFVFLDADKEGQVDYFHALYPRALAPGGILAAHNAVRQAGAMRDYLALVRNHRDFDTVTVSATMDDGVCLSYRRRTA